VTFCFFTVSFPLSSFSAAATTATPRSGRSGPRLLPQLLLESLAHLHVPREVPFAERGIIPVLRQELRPSRLGPAVEERLDLPLRFALFFGFSISREKSRGDFVLVVLFALEGCGIVSGIFGRGGGRKGEKVGEREKERLSFVSSSFSHHLPSKTIISSSVRPESTWSQREKRGKRTRKVRNERMKKK
jgi:hypothetical protein